MAMGMINVLLPQKAALKIKTLLLDKPYYHSLLYAVMSGNTFSQNVHNFLVVMAVLTLQIQDWSKVTSTF